MQDDFSFDLVDWSVRNKLSVALANTVYLWDATTKESFTIYETESPETMITAVKWN